MSRPRISLGAAFHIMQHAWNDALSATKHDVSLRPHQQPTYSDFIDSLIVFLTQRLRALPGYQGKGGAL